MLGVLDRGQRSGARFPLLVGVTCLPWLAIVVFHHVRTPLGNQLAVSLAALTLAAHVPTTFAFYADRGLWPFMARNRARFVWGPVLAVVGGAVFAWSAPVGLLSAGITAFIAWQLHHFTRQNLGMLAFLFRARRRPAVSAEERSLVNVTGVAGILGFAPFYAGIPGVSDDMEQGAWFAGMAVLLYGVVRLARLWSSDPLRSAALASVVLFYAPLFLYPGDVFVATISFSAAHGAQYLLMVGHLGSGRPRVVSIRWLVLVATLSIAGGELLDRTRALEGTGLRWVYGLGVGITAAHFVIDAGLWRLRDDDQRAWMRERFAFL